MGNDQPPQLPVDPNLQADQQRAQNDLTKNLQAQASGDTANLMARYGTRLAMAGGMTSPLIASRT